MGDSKQQSLSDSLSCNVCYNYYDSSNHLPRSLSCGHTFCTQCLTQLHQSEKKLLIKCPNDRKVTRVSSITELAPNFALLDVIQASSRKTTSKPVIKPVQDDVELDYPSEYPSESGVAEEPSAEFEEDAPQPEVRAYPEGDDIEYPEAEGGYNEYDELHDDGPAPALEPSGPELEDYEVPEEVSYHEMDVQEEDNGEQPVYDAEVAEIDWKIEALETQLQSLEQPDNDLDDDYEPQPDQPDYEPADYPGGVDDGDENAGGADDQYEPMEDIRYHQNPGEGDGYYVGDEDGDVGGGGGDEYEQHSYQHPSMDYDQDEDGYF